MNSINPFNYDSPPSSPPLKRRRLEPINFNSPGTPEKAQAVAKGLITPPKLNKTPTGSGEKNNGGMKRVRLFNSPTPKFGMNIKCDSPNDSAKMVNENKESVISFNKGPPQVKKHSKKDKTNPKLEHCQFNGENYKLTVLSTEGTMSDVYLMSNGQNTFVYKILKPKLKTELQGAINQYLELNAKQIPVAKIYNNPIKDGYVVEEYFPQILNQKATHYSEQTEPYFVAYGQFIKKVIESGVKNVDVKPNNIGIRLEKGKIECYLFDFDCPDCDETILRITQGIRMICGYNPKAAAKIAEQLKGINGAEDIIKFCESIAPMQVITDFDLD